MEDCYIYCPYCDEEISEELYQTIYDDLDNNYDSADYICNNCEMKFNLELIISKEYAVYKTEQDEPKKEEIKDIPGQTLFEFN